MKNSARTFVARNFLTSDAAKSLLRIGNSDCISELSCSGCARTRAPGSVRLLYAKSARANSQERFREEKKKQGRRKKRKERRRHYSTQFLAFSSRTALVSRFYVNGPLLKRLGNQIRINGPSSVSLDADFTRDGRSRSLMRLRKKTRNTNRARYKISPTFHYYMYARALCASFFARARAHGIFIFAVWLSTCLNLFEREANNK